MESHHIDGFGRVRKEGPDKITLTIKKFKLINGRKMAEEFEVIVNNFKNASDILSASGFTKQQFQEKYREKWSLPDSNVNEIQLSISNSN